MVSSPWLAGMRLVLPALAILFFALVLSLLFSSAGSAAPSPTGGGAPSPTGSAALSPAAAPVGSATAPDGRASGRAAVSSHLLSAGPVSRARRAKRKCRRGYALKTVRRHGRKVRRCRKAAPAEEPEPDSHPFQAPGRRLVGEEAMPFLQRYLWNSTFTDCPEGFPNCSLEERYSHTSGGAFYYCRLSLDYGSDVVNGPRAYRVQNAIVEADGSWTFTEVVDNDGGPVVYEWHLAADGVVSGFYRSGGTEQLGPFQYVGGTRDCSYSY